jgi:hypothetical protein
VSGRTAIVPPMSEGRRRAAEAHQEALRRLIKAKPVEYERLLAEERAKEGLPPEPRAR